MSTATHERLAPEHDASQHTGSMQLVSFKLAEETYGIEITKIREIILVGEITRIPEAPPYVKGLINLRSTVIPVIDLRIRFALADTDVTAESRIMVLRVGNHMIGIVVDSVSEVLRVAHQDISPAPPTVTSAGNMYMTGLVRLKADLLILLDVDRLFTDEEGQALVDAAVCAEA
jgi:purine-binding chemotaxis protein CheW